MKRLICLALSLCVLICVTVTAFAEGGERAAQNTTVPVSEVPEIDTSEPDAQESTAPASEAPEIDTSEPDAQESTAPASEAPEIVTSVPETQESTVPAEEEKEEDPEKIYRENLNNFQKSYSETVSVNTAFVETLIDYDLALKRLAAAKERYDAQKLKIVELEDGFRFGSVDMNDIRSAKKELDTVFYEIKTLLVGISIMKTDIESVLGRGFSNSFDFDSVYFITDATKISDLPDLTKLASICVPPKKESVSDQETDIGTVDASSVPLAIYAKNINSAISVYYSLGEAVLDYDSAYRKYDDAKADYLHGKITRSELTKAKIEKTAAFNKAYELKAAYSKALLELDALCGYSLTYGYAGGSAAVKPLCASFSENGNGLWKISEYNGKLYFKIIAFPKMAGMNNYTGYTLTYNGTELGSGALGSICSFKAPVYHDGGDYAYFTIKAKNGEDLKYRINVFSPLGGFE